YSKNVNCCRLTTIFFFSSRRRHTSFSRDWSSDVCSSDLGLLGDVQAGQAQAGLQVARGADGVVGQDEEGDLVGAQLGEELVGARSVERPVGNTLISRCRALMIQT